MDEEIYLIKLLICRKEVSKRYYLEDLIHQCP